MALKNFLYVHEGGELGTIPVTICDICFPHAILAAQKVNKDLLEVDAGTKQFCSYQDHKEIKERAMAAKGDAITRSR